MVRWEKVQERISKTSGAIRYREPVSSSKELVDREAELTDLLRAIFHNRKMILVLGSKGVGKTSVVQVVRSLMTDEKATLIDNVLVPMGLAKRADADVDARIPFPVYMSLQGVGAASFLSEIIVTIAEYVQNKKLAKLKVIIDYLSSITEIEVSTTGVRLKRELKAKIEERGSLKVFEEVYKRIVEQYPAGLVCLLDDADVLSRTDFTPVREELYRFLETEELLLNLVFVVYEQRDLSPLSKIYAVINIPQLDEDSLTNIALRKTKDLLHLTEANLKLIREAVRGTPLFLDRVIEAIEDRYGKEENQDHLVESAIEQAFLRVFDELDEGLKQTVVALDKLGGSGTPLEVAKEAELGDKVTYKYLNLLETFGLAISDKKKPKTYTRIPELQGISGIR